MAAEAHDGLAFLRIGRNLVAVCNVAAGAEKVRLNLQRSGGRWWMRADTEESDSLLHILAKADELIQSGETSPLLAQRCAIARAP